MVRREFGRLEGDEETIGGLGRFLCATCFETGSSDTFLAESRVDSFDDSDIDSDTPWVAVV